MMVAESSDLLTQVCSLARKAGDAILDVYERDVAVELKEDRSPLTEADRISHRILCDGLRALRPELPILSEESAPGEMARRREWERYWLVDPLDGTKEFLKQNGEFTVNVALVEAHRAVLGVVFAPALDLLYFGALDAGAHKQAADGRAHAIRVADKESAPLRVVGSRSHAGDRLAAYLEHLGPHELKPMGSSLKICLVAEGEADVYPRLGPTSEWDTAAAQAVLESAGGALTDTAGRPLRYNTKDGLLNPDFLAVGNSSRDWTAFFREG
jgi:3'(2'), 5'-bisphosphate nucleotidase